VRLTLLFLAGAGALSCSGREGSPQAVFEHANQAYLQGDLKQSQEQAGRAYQQFRTSRPDWAWKFRILEAKAALSTGPSEDVLKFLQSEPLPSGQSDVSIQVLTLIGVANINIRKFAEAERSLNHASMLCSDHAASSCGEVLQARGLLASQRTDSVAAEQLYQQSLLFARSHGDRFLESTSLLNLGNESLTQAHFDEAIDRSEAAYQAAKTVGAKIVELITQGNIGWAYYKLGDSDKALGLFLEAEKRASELGDFVDQGAWLTDAGYVYMGARKYRLAEQSFLRALELEQRVNSQEEIYNVQRALARLALETGELERASQHGERALAIARESGNHVGELYPMLVQGQVAARRGDAAGAESTFRKVERDPSCPVFLKWETEHSLARLYEDEKRPDAADREYRAALATFEAARDTVRHEDSQLSFLTNASRIYDDYVHFLVAHEKTNDALRWADYSRARTLAEGLGLLAKGPSGGPPALNAPEISRRAKGALLFYWLGEKQSYLWAITPPKTSLFPLPPGPEIEAVVKRYRETLAGPQDVLVSADADGRWLYRMLVAPAQSMLAARPSGAKALALGRSSGTAQAVPFPNSLEPGPKVFVIPDGSLNNLNFETLLVAEPKLHYWIEDATIADASSLRVLAASYANANKRPRRLLLVGNSVPPNEKYPALPKAAAQMESVARHFSADGQQVLSGEQATPSAYLESKPKRFSHIHFVAHGIASRLSPLDSAIVLSRGGAENDSFKLYARDILRHPLRADLVTISACYGAGERAYSGEGLVGLSWAFLRAGAHNVIAALWEATDVPTEQLMSKFYDELDRGATPDAALRTAKLSLLRGGAFHNPFYWAPFQLYAGS